MQSELFCRLSLTLSKLALLSVLEYYPCFAEWGRRLKDDKQTAEDLLVSKTFSFHSVSQKCLRNDTKIIE